MNQDKEYLRIQDYLDMKTIVIDKIGDITFTVIKMKPQVADAIRYAYHNQN